jgi:hypothetical protein
VIDVEVIDRNSLPQLLDEDGFFSIENTTGFLLGCIKALILRLEALEQA